MDGCEVWFAFKMTKNQTWNGDISKYSSMMLQGLILDYICMIKRSQEKSRIEWLNGVNGQQEYLLISEHHTGKLWDVPYGINNPP